MPSLRTDWSEPIRVYRQIKNNIELENPDARQQNLLKFPYRVDFGNILAEIHPEEIPLTSFQSEEDFKGWLNEKFSGTEWNGVLYFFTRCWVHYIKHKQYDKARGKWKKGRPTKPHKRRWMGGNNCVAKFEMYNGEVVHIFRKKGKRKYAPYERPQYEILKAIEDNNRKELV